MPHDTSELTLSLCLY